MENKNNGLRLIIGWATFIITLFITSFWSYWGISEAFHEGWYHTSILQNLSLTFVQYLSIPLVFLGLSSIALNYKKIGGGLFILCAIFAMFFFNSDAGRILVFVPLILLSLGFYFGEFKHRKIFLLLLMIIPILLILSFGIPQLIKVEKRFNDNDFGVRIIEGNNVNLTWAQEGFGFPLYGTDWKTAKDNCARLNDEGTMLENNEVNFWRLPTREEIIGSMTKGNKNSGGFLDEFEIAKYETKPDKETPLWNPHSKIIYYWTSETKNEKQAFLVAYNGKVLDRMKSSGANYQGYRCVRE